MLPRRSRIHASRDFPVIYKKGKRRETPLFVIWIYQKPDGPFRATVLASKKFSKRAVERNTAKRRLREILRKEIMARFPRADIIVSLKAGSGTPSSSEFKSSLFHALSL